MELHHPHIQHGRQLGQRQDGNTEQRGDHAREAVVDAALAAHLAGNPFQHLGIDVDGLARRPAFDAVSGDSATVRGGTGRPDSDAA